MTGPVRVELVTVNFGWSVESVAPSAGAVGVGGLMTTGVKTLKLAGGA